MGGLLLALVLASPDAAACRDALLPEPGSLAERAQVMVRACGALISSPPCRKAFARHHAVGQRPVPLRQLVAACWSSYCRWNPEIPCDQKPATDSIELLRQWHAVSAALWRHEARPEAEVITNLMERNSWVAKVTDEPIGSMELRIQGNGVVLIARFGAGEQRWAMPAKPVQQDYAGVQAWLEREVWRSGLIDIAGEGPVRFTHVKLLMNAVVCAGQPALHFRLIR